MATTYKTFLAEDINYTRTLLHESIPITGTLVYGTYAEKNIKNYSHGRFQSVYDYVYLSSSANHIFDLTAGFSRDSALSGSGALVPQKIQMYNQLSQMLVGHDVTGSILKFDEDGDLLGTTADKQRECIFFSFSRLLVKDEIKKGSVELKLGNGAYTSRMSTVVTITDAGAADEYRVNSPAGEYGILYNGSTKVGHVFYQAGIMVLTASVFSNASFISDGTVKNVGASLSTSTIQVFSDEVRKRIQNIAFNNTVELNSTIYFCRIGQNEFNYSSNPTYLSASKIIVKGDDDTLNAEPVSYITTVGLYSSDNELLAVAKLSEPLKKTPQNALILRTRLDF